MAIAAAIQDTVVRLSSDLHGAMVIIRVGDIQDGADGMALDFIITARRRGLAT